MIVDHLPKPRTARGCVITAVAVSIFWLAVFAASLYVVVTNWNG